VVLVITVYTKFFIFILTYLFVFFFILSFFPIVLPLLIAIAFFTLLERKILGSIQRRRGPNVVGIFGFLQAFADAIKLFTKETIITISSNQFIFIFAAIFSFALSLLNWSVIPFGYDIVVANINISSIFVLAVSSLGVFSIIMAGWSSNSKYSFLGSLRSAAQLISYEVSLGFLIMPVLIASCSSNIIIIVFSQGPCFFFLPFFFSFVLFFVSLLAETNRIPFDSPEAESELVSGYNVEYSSVGFVLFFLAEYSNILLMCCFMTCLFFGGWLPFTCLFFLPFYIWYFIKVFLLMFVFVWLRGTLPRYRYDQLMALCWKFILPISVLLLVLYFFLILVFLV
jgi:NADH-quinone oxidoreductase subunit H